MYRAILTALALATATGCASQLQQSAAHHQARAAAFEAAGDGDAALHEREKADRAREQVAPLVRPNDQDPLPPLTAF
jgi:hypothetical protein